MDTTWRGHAAVAHYSDGRFANGRAAGRDPRLVARALRRHGLRGPLLDVPSGSGRLGPVLERLAAQVAPRVGPPVVAADVSLDMLTGNPRGERVQASVFALPFHDRSFDAVVCCRLLHHLREPGDLEAAVAELVRVSTRLILASYWDAHSLPAVRRRLGLKRPEARVAIPPARLARAFELAGARLVDRFHSLRFVSQQAFAVARRTSP